MFYSCHGHSGKSNFFFADSHVIVEALRTAMATYPFHYLIRYTYGGIWVEDDTQYGSITSAGSGDTFAGFNMLLVVI